MKNLFFFVIAALFLITAAAFVTPLSSAPEGLIIQPVKNEIITGTVTDENGDSLIGATVIEKGTANGTITDYDGKYSLSVSDKNAVLVFSYTGFSTQEIQLGESNVVNVVMAEGIHLDEVVVVGLGVRKEKKSLSYAVTTTEPKKRKIRKRDKNTMRMLRGNVRGVEITNAPASHLINFNNYSDAEDVKISITRLRLVSKDSINDFSAERYDEIFENPFQEVTKTPLSTFSIDVDAASYSNMRRFINYGNLPPKDAVRIEEMVNYFNYDYPQPTGEHPFEIITEISDCPWQKGHKLLHVGLQGKRIATDKLPPSNLVFLLDVSGSMSSPNKLPLLQQSLSLLVDNLRQQDFVSIVVYAGAAGVVLKPTSGVDGRTIKNALNKLQAGGSTAGGAGIKLAYKLARENFIKGGNNRVILATDGDFNVGVSTDNALVKMIEKERESGIFLTVLGFGMGNYQDAKMQKLADKGNGNHAYIDNLAEAKKVLVSEFGGTIFTIAKDVKLQLEFNADQVKGYRLIGYENRLLTDEDFDDDTKDAGEMGAGHTVTALYEIIPANYQTPYITDADESQMREVAKQKFSGSSEELVHIKFRYKAPDGEKSKLIEKGAVDNNIAWEKSSENFRWSASVAEFGLLLRDSKYKGASNWKGLKQLAKNAKGKDLNGYRREMIELIGDAEVISRKIMAEK